MAEMVLFTGKSHNTSGPSGGSRSADGFVNLKMAEPHPAAENLFSAAWSHCYMGALGLAASQRKIKPTGDFAVDTEIDLVRDGSSFFLRARMKVSIPGVDRAQAQELIDIAHTICPYSKAVHGNVEVTTTLA